MFEREIYSGLMLAERGELVEVLHRNCRASPNTWRK